MQQRKGYSRMAKTYIIIQEKSYKINYKFHVKSIYYILECSILWFKTSWNGSVQCIRSSSPKCHLNYNFMNIKKCNKDELNGQKKCKSEYAWYKSLCVFKNQDMNQLFSPTAGIWTEEKSGIFYAQVWERLLLCSVNPCPHIYWDSQGESGSHCNHKNTLTCTRKHFITL